MHEPSLRQVQQWMKSRIRPQDARASSEARTTLLNPQRGTPGETRLAVYAEGYVARIRESLAEVYEAVQHVLGKRAFAELACGYAQRHPSHDYNLSLVGRHLPEFLRTSALAQRLPFLPDLAALEWLVYRAFHAVEQAPLDPSRLVKLPPEEWDQARLTFQPAVGVVASAWPILDIWETRTRVRSEINIDLANRPQRVLVFRQQLQVRCELLDEPQSLLLDGLLKGQTLGAVCAALSQHHEETLPVAQWFTEWARRGLLVGCELAAPPA